MKKIFIVLLLLFSARGQFVSCQDPSVMNSADILLGLEKLKTAGSVLFIAAHPDDENTRLLSYLTSGRMLNTAYLSLTRGDGGQNLVGKEQGELLGLLRTQELLAARRIDGAEQFFTRANDFGYSKNPEETFGFWNRDSILADVVWVIRNFRPDVIIMRFPTTGEGGHGHHTASAILAVDAFDAAADPNMFPEQLKYVKTWQAKRIFWNTYSFGNNNTTSPDQLQIDIGKYNPLLGRSYGEISSLSRSMHKSQGFGSALYRGSQTEFFKLIKGEPYSADMFDGIDQSLNRLPGTGEIQKAIDGIVKNFDALNPGKSVNGLANLYRMLMNIPENNETDFLWKYRKSEETRRLILACAGIWLEAAASDYSAIPGGGVEITSQIISRNLEGVKLNKLHYLGSSDSTADMTLGENILYTIKHNGIIPAYRNYSSPYWLEDKHTTGLYTVTDQMLRGKPENDPAAYVRFDIEIEGLYMPVIMPLVYKYTDPVKGEIYRPFEILPPVTVNSTDKVYVFANSKPRSVQFRLKSNTPNISGKLEALVSGGWKIEIKNPDFTLPLKGDETIIEAVITPPENTSSGMLQLAAVISGDKYNKSIKRVEYDHIPYQFILSDAEAKLVRIDLKTGGKKIGYIAGAGDDVAESLTLAGYMVTMLSDEMLLSGDLSVYDAIVSGIRAYNTNDRLQVHYGRLMEYIKQGGNLVVQYNTNNRIGPIVAKMAPYPFNISRERVTDENAEVRFLNPSHPLLNEPNKITQSDFDGWIQERGIYFANELAPEFETVISMNDPGEDPKDGSLVIAKYGKGNFIYTGLVFFRELPAGVPGAYRLFANILALKK